MQTYIADLTSQFDSEMARGTCNFSRFPHEARSASQGSHFENPYYATSHLPKKSVSTD